MKPQNTCFEPGEVKESFQVATMASARGARDNSLRPGVLKVGTHACAHDLSLYYQEASLRDIAVLSLAGPAVTAVPTWARTPTPPSPHHPVVQLGGHSRSASIDIVASLSRAASGRADSGYEELEVRVGKKPAPRARRVKSFTGARTTDVTTRDSLPTT